MTQITDLNVGDIVRVTLFDGETVNAVYEITEVFKDFRKPQYTTVQIQED